MLDLWGSNDQDNHETKALIFTGSNEKCSITHSVLRFIPALLRICVCREALSASAPGTCICFLLVRKGLLEKVNGHGAQATFASLADFFSTRCFFKKNSYRKSVNGLLVHFHDLWFFHAERGGQRHCQDYPGKPHIPLDCSWQTDNLSSREVLPNIEPESLLFLSEILKKKKIIHGGCQQVKKQFIFILPPLFLFYLSLSFPKGRI